MDVTARRRIPAAPTQVAAHAMEWRHDHEWTQGIRAAAWTKEAPGGGFGEGAQVTRTAYFLRKRIDHVLRVAAHEPPTVLDMVSVEGPFPMCVTYRFDAVPGEADAKDASMRVKGGKGVMGLVCGPPVRRDLARDLRDLEARLA